MTSLTLVDLFAGCGGGSLGFKAAGFKPVGAVEIDVDAAGSYHENIGLNPVVRDVRRVTGQQLLDGAGLAPGALTLLFGCPPCQSFTVLRQGQQASAVDRARNKLPLEYLRLVRELRPRHVAFENVPGLSGPKGRYRLRQLLTGLSDLGYAYVLEELDAKDFGVPQHRTRLVLVGSRVTQPALPAPTHGEPGSGLLPYRTVRDAISQLPPALPPSTRPGEGVDILHRARNHRPVALQRLRALAEGQARADLPEDLQLDCHKKHGGHYDIYGRMWWDRPAPTLTSGCTNITRGRFAHPEQDRAITVREALLLQTFPPAASLCGGIESMSQQVGNAVPPTLARALGLAVAKMERDARRRRSAAAVRSPV